MTARAIVVTEARFYSHGRGHYFSPTGGRAYEFWQRYLRAFNSVTVVARSSVDVPVEGRVGFQVDGDHVEVESIRDYTGGRGTATALPRLVWHMWRLSAAADTVFVLRVPSVIAGVLSLCLAVRRRRFVLEVVGDPAAVFESGVGGRIGPAAGAVTSALLRWQCRTAVGVSYVTDRALQTSYPAGPRAVQAVYSSVDLPAEAIATAPRVRRATSCRLVNVGTMSQRYKGQDLLLEVLARLRAAEHDVSLTLVGDGALRQQLEAQASSLGVLEHVDFVGLVPAGQPVRDELDRADIFVLSSRTEGLPRALIEAMARGLPCVGSDVGGVGELLPERAIFLPDDLAALESALVDVLVDQDWRERLAHHCHARSLDFSDEVLEVKRTEFLLAVQGKSTES